MLLALLLAAQVGGGAPAVAFPADAAGLEPTTGLPLLAPRLDELAGLALADHVVLTGLPLPGGAVDLELTRQDLARLKLGFHVDGVPAPGLLDGLDLSVWHGRVLGDTQSEVVLSFSTAGTRGWLQSQGQLWHLMPQPGPSGTWADSVVVLANDLELQRFGMSETRTCLVDTDSLGVVPAPTLDAGASDVYGPPTHGTLGSSCTGWEAAVAVETDWQMYQNFNDLAAESAYMTALLASISGRFQEQIDTTLTFPYIGLYSTSNDGWSTPDSADGNDSFAMLSEFSNAWEGNLPGGAIIAHFVSGSNLGGGVSPVGALCQSSQQDTFSVSGNLGGTNPLPIQQGPFNWDWIVISHETGHMFGALHTHSYCPPIDQCASGQAMGSCQDQTVCTTSGTIMSYCHTCGSGMSNVTTFFHPQIVSVMQAQSGQCLPNFDPLDGSGQPTVLTPDVPTTVTLQVGATPQAGVDLNYRYDGGAFQVVPMTDLGGGTWSGDLPAPSCSAEPEWFFSTVDVACGPFQTQVYTGGVGDVLPVFTDDFEAAGGWVVGAPDDDASTGVWEQIDPVGTAAQPGDDHTPGGTQCFVTGQQPGGGSLGTNDVDDGKTTLTSPPIDLSGGDAIVSYWRWYSNDTGGGPSADVFTVDVSNDGGQSWVNAETVGPGGAEASGEWFYHEFPVSDFVAPTGDVRVRFVAADEDQGSLVEAAVDDFQVYRLSCDSQVCQQDIGFAGPGSATLTLCGDALGSGGQGVLQVNGASPNTVVYVAWSLSSTPTPIFAGTLAAFPPALVFTYTSDATGGVQQVVPGGGASAHTLWVQAVYLDFFLPGGWGFTNALAVEVLP